MLGVLAAFAVVSAFVMLPVFWEMALHGRAIGQLWGYSPNQFLFSILPFPAAAFCTFVSLRNLIIRVKTNPTAVDTIARWLVENWTVMLLVGVIIASTVTIADYFYTAKSFDRLQPQYADEAVKAAEGIQREIENYGDKDRDSRRAEMLNSAKRTYRQIAHGPRLRKAQILALDPPVYLKVVTDARLQRQWHLLDPTAHSLSVLQLFTALFVGYCALLVIGVCYLMRVHSPHVDVSHAVNALRYAVLFFAVYPICYRYFLAEVQLVSGDMTSTIRGDIMSAMLIAAAAGAVLALDTQDRTAFAVLGRAFPFLLVVGPSAYAALAGPLSLRGVIGIDANPGLRITLYIVMLIITALIVLAVWPRALDHPLRDDTLRSSKREAVR